ncbi:MAG: spermidine synthase [Bryobacterales bacterium]|nr:spermidine synthase [Bryobacterales bacterium]
MSLYALTIFLSAFLLFQVQPLIAKTILAWFGGTASVWTTCMLFFQLELLLGYLYAHFSISRLRPRPQAILHTVLLGMAVLLLPVIPSPAWKPAGSENPTVQILLLLLATVGLPYLLCSTTGPLVQAWYARRERGAAPYHLFALSNLGSMLALLSYPPLVEPYLPTRQQAWIWSGAFVVFAVLCAAVAWRSARGEEEAASVPTMDRGPAPGWLAKLQWVTLAACPSILMLAVTNHLTQDVASIPFLWILPLTIYLLSFILTFDARGWYRPNIFLLLLAPSLAGMAYLQWTESYELGVVRTIAIFAVALFVACMVCHGELAARKPAPAHLTSFYLMLSIGGALGGLFVGVVAPYLFISYFELPAGIALCGVLAWLIAIDEPDLTWPQRVASVSSLSLLIGVSGLTVFLVRSMRDSVKDYELVQRNFYGSLRVRESNPGQWEGYRTLLHGSINHGEQWTHPERRRDLLTYYCANSGIGRAMKRRVDGVPRKVAVLGLGAGTMAAFGRPGDEFRFYEINPIVPKLATTQFTFLPDSKAKTEVVLGDARLSLEREASQQFDIIMMDAFSGDSIPVHLVTIEAFEQYFRHLKNDGIIVVHISNKYLDLEPVLAAAARTLGKAARVFETGEDDDGNCFGTTYVLVANSTRVFDEAPFQGSGHEPRVDDKVPAWTDGYSNMFRILK